MTTTIPLPPQHANAPTPRTDALRKTYAGISNANPNPLLDHHGQLEREQQYMMEVLESLNKAIKVHFRHAHNNRTTEEIDDSITAYNNLKSYMEQKKGETKG